jgi:hypothetical protein
MSVKKLISKFLIRIFGFMNNLNEMLERYEQILKLINHWMNDYFC